MNYTKDQLFALRSDVVKDMDFDALVIEETWLTGNVSDQKSGGNILLRDSLKCETHLRFPAKCLEIYLLTSVIEGISVRVAIIYRLHQHERHDFFRNLWKLLTPLLQLVAIS